MPGTDVAYGATPTRMGTDWKGRRRRKETEISWYGTPCCTPYGIVLRARYGKSGTDVGYAATRFCGTTSYGAYKGGIVAARSMLCRVRRGERFASLVFAANNGSSRPISRCTCCAVLGTDLLGDGATIPYATPGTDLGYGATMPYALSGTDLGYMLPGDIEAVGSLIRHGADVNQVRVPITLAYDATTTSLANAATAISLRARYAMCSTDVGYGAASVRCAVLT
eukprot:3925745-Rhodomonas_salina.3